MCNTGRCIEKELRCDGWADCTDYSDEISCRESGLRDPGVLLPFLCVASATYPRKARGGGRLFPSRCKGQATVSWLLLERVVLSQYPQLRSPSRWEVVPKRERLPQRPQLPGSSE